MLAVDTKLEQLNQEKRPIQVALVGAGVTGSAISVQLLTPIPGIRLAVIANRSLEKAERAFKVKETSPSIRVTTAQQLDEAIKNNLPAVTDDAMIVCESSRLDVVIEVTGTVEFAARVAMGAIQHRKHVVLVNAELDSALGPILKDYASRAGVVITNTDGDEPGVAMTLLRYLKSIGLRPVAAGNLKGMIDHYRTPETQHEFAKKYNQDAMKVTSFADGTKLAMEATILANATGFGIGIRGMYGPACSHVSEIAKLLPADQMLSTGLVDYALGAAPHTGAFVVVHEDNPLKMDQLKYYKMGDGPFYVFYTPFHLPHIQVASTIARAVLHQDPTVSASGRPVCEVLTMAKRDLSSGEVLDGPGGFMSYGVIERAALCFTNSFLPMGLSEKCRLKRNVPKDQPISYTDVELPPNRLCDKLKAEQNAMFFKKIV